MPRYAAADQPNRQHAKIGIGCTARGVDIFTVRDGKIAEKLTYVTMS